MSYDLWWKLMVEHLENVISERKHNMKAEEILSVAETLKVDDPNDYTRIGFYSLQALANITASLETIAEVTSEQKILPKLMSDFEMVFKWWSNKARYSEDEEIMNAFNRLFAVTTEFPNVGAVLLKWAKMFEEEANRRRGA